MTVIHSLKCTVSFSFVIPLAVTRCHPLPFVVTRCHPLPLVVIRCHSLSLVVTRCTIRLSFYKRSNISGVIQFMFRSSHQTCSVRKSVLRNFTKFPGKHLCQSLLFTQITNICFHIFHVFLMFNKVNNLNFNEKDDLHREQLFILDLI